MTNISGNEVVITDSDALIGLVSSEDLLHKQCVKINQYLRNNNIDTFTPYPIVLEAATVLARVLGRHDLALKILQDYTSTEDKIDTDVSDLVAEFFNLKTSKKNTPFDHYILALARKNNIQCVFSFDSFYKKNGLTLMQDLV